MQKRPRSVWVLVRGQGDSGGEGGQVLSAYFAQAAAMEAVPFVWPGENRKWKRVKVRRDRAALRWQNGDNCGSYVEIVCVTVIDSLQYFTSEERS